MKVQYIVFVWSALVFMKVAADLPTIKVDCYVNECMINESEGVSECPSVGDANAIPKETCDPKYTGNICKCAKRIFQHKDEVSGEWKITAIMRSYRGYTRSEDQELKPIENEFNIVPDSVKLTTFYCFTDGCNL